MLALFTRSRPRNPLPPGTPGQATQPTVTMRFRTRGGAEVHVLEDHTFRCQGCDYEDNYNRSVTTARRDANGHAEGCYSMPKPTRDA